MLFDIIVAKVEISISFYYHFIILRLYIVCVIMIMFMFQIPSIKEGIIRETWVSLKRMGS